MTDFCAQFLEWPATITLTGRRQLTWPVGPEAGNVRKRGIQWSPDESRREALSARQEDNGPTSAQLQSNEKDTRSYSVFLHEDGQRAYAVQGLTARLRDICGCSGMVARAGVFPLSGQFVCDGPFGGVTMLGPNYLADFKARYQILRECGDFHAVPARVEAEITR